MSQILFLLTYALEASVRKYFLSTTVIIFFKYIFLFNIKFKKYIFNYTLVLLCLSFPLIIHALSKTYVPSLDLAIYDLMAIFMAPILILAIVTNDKIENYKLDRIFLYLIIFVGLAHSLLVIIQAVAEPESLLNVSVYGDNSNHYFGDAVKVTGLISAPYSYLNISAILSIWYLRDSSCKSIFKKISFIVEIIILSSGLFNLITRSYFVFLLFPYAIEILNVTYKSIKNLKFKPKVIFSLGLSILLLILFINRVTNFDRQDKVLSASLQRYQLFFLVERVAPLYTDLFNINRVPDFSEAPGIGTTVGAKEKSNIESVDSIEACDETGKEWEYKRMICISGAYGYILILFCRLIPAFYLLTIIFYRYKKNKYKSSWNGILIISALIFTQAQFNLNDVLAGILCISLTSNTIYRIGLLEQGKFSKQQLT